MVWHNTIIDGHHRWKIIQKHPGIPYKIKQMDFPDKWSAIVWMCRNQLGRRNVTQQQRDYLIAQEYGAQRKTVTNEAGINQYQKEVTLRGENLVVNVEKSKSLRNIRAVKKQLQKQIVGTYASFQKAEHREQEIMGQISLYDEKLGSKAVDFSAAQW